jgi:hypothetical protein
MEGIRMLWSELMPRLFGSLPAPPSCPLEQHVDEVRESMLADYFRLSTSRAGEETLLGDWLLLMSGFAAVDEILTACERLIEKGALFQARGILLRLHEFVESDRLLVLLTWVNYFLGQEDLAVGYASRARHVTPGK